MKVIDEFSKYQILLIQEIPNGLLRLIIYRTSEEI